LDSAAILDENLSLNFNEKDRYLFRLFRLDYRQHHCTFLGFKWPAYALSVNSPMK
tara:strand:- start:254 stop:418 length:165 start_codon:yes stop_codon:yes gene_type:complete